MEKLYLNNNNIVGNEGARAFANALASNRKLQILALSNNGITAVVDHRGDIIKQIPQFQEAVLSVDVPLVSGLTPYARYTRIIDFSIPLLLLAFAFIRQRQQFKASD